MPFKLDFLWDDNKTRQLLRRHLILVIFGSVPVIIYGLFYQENDASRLIFITSPLISISVALYSLSFINKIKSSGYVFLINILVPQMVTSFNMAAGGGFLSIFQFVPYALIFLTVFQLGSRSALVLSVFTVINLAGVATYLILINSPTDSIFNFLLYLVIYIILVVIFNNIGKELSVQIEARKKLEQVDDLKNQFISLSSHYLRTPIAVIKAFTSALQKTSLDEKQKDDLKGIEKNVEDLNILIDKFIAIASIERGEAKINATPGDFVKLVQSLVSDFRNQAEQNQVILTFKEVEQIVPKFSFDEPKLRQAIASVLDNAIRYNRPGGYVIVSIRKEADEVLLKIEDTGFGMKKEHLETLFTTFNIGGMEKVLTMGKVGIGLNLYLTKLIIESHKGKITLESEEGKGSIVTISIPIK